MATFVSDTFTDTAGTNLTAHTGETGATWTEHASWTGGNLLISDANRARESAGAVVLAYASGSPATAEYDITAPMRRITALANANLGLAARIDTATDTFYWADYSAASSRWQVGKRVNGTSTTLATYIVTPTLDQDYTVVFKIRDNRKSLWIDGVERIVITDNSITAAGKVGIWANTAAATGNATGWHMGSFTAADATDNPSAWEQVWNEPWSSDTRANYTFDAGDSGDTEVSGGFLRAAAAGHATSVGINTTATNQGNRQRTTIKFRWTTGGGAANAGNFGAICKRTATGQNFLLVDVNGVVASPSLRLFVVTGASFSSKTTVAITGATIDTDYWVRCTVDGNLVVGEFFTADPYAAEPPVPAFAVKHVLIDADRTAYGRGVTGDAGFRYFSTTGAGANSHMIDQIRFDEWSDETADPLLEPSGSPTTVDNAADHQGFPGFCTMPNGNRLMVFRTATSHTSLDGNLVSRIYSGGSWSARSTVLDTANNLNGCMLSVVGSRIWLSYYENVTAADYSDRDVKCIYSDDNASTWSSPVTIASGPFLMGGAVCESPIISIGADLYIAVFGKDENDAASELHYCKCFKSTDNGATWAEFSTIVARSTTMGYAEPSLYKLASGRILCFVRGLDPNSGWERGFLTYSDDSCATWSTVQMVFNQLYSRVSCYETAADGIVVAYRVDEYGTTGRAVVRQCADPDTAPYTWSEETEFLTSGQFEYGQMNTDSGGIGFAYCNGASTTADAFFDTFALEAGAGIGWLMRGFG
jgi:hypothetical protein